MKKLYILFIMFGLFFVPYVETQAYTIDSLDEKLIISKNLFNKDDIFTADGYYDFNTGTFVTNTSVDSYQLELIPGETYIKTDIGLGTAYYDASNNFISGQSGTTITIPLTAKYTRFPVQKTLQPTAQLELGSTATTYEPYYNLSLREVFENNNLVTNYDFSDGQTSWLGAGTLNTISVENEKLTFNGTAAGSGGRYQDISGNSLDKFYISFETQYISLNYPGFWVTNNGSFTNATIYTSLSTGRYSYIHSKTNGIRIYFQQQNAFTYNNYTFDNIYAFNLTQIGIDTLSKSEMDYWFNEYQKMLAYNEGFTDTTTYQTGYNTGFEFGYNTGYTDAVTEDNAYSLGYALGLQEGQDMETGSSIIVLVLALMAFAMMLFGFTSKRRIFNLFASGLFIALGAILFEYPAFIIVTIGLVIVNVYYTFVSD